MCSDTFTVTARADGTPTLLLLGSGHRPYREYALRALAARYRVVLVDQHQPSWQEPHIVDHAVTDLRDLRAVRTAVAAVCGDHTLQGVVTWDEFATVTAARVAADLGLPGPDPDAVARCRNKAASRRTLDATGVPSARWEHVADLNGARSAADRIGYPVVLKPAAAGGSMGVVRADDPTQLREAFDFTERATCGQGDEGTGMLVESYLPGPEVSVEVLTDRGRHHVLAITTKLLSDEPYFEEAGHVVAGTPHPAHPAAEVATAALDALGISHGISHVELRLTPTGPRIVEVNPRIAGDLIGHLVYLATGVDLPGAAGDLAAGRAPELTPTRNRAAGIRFVYPHAAGQLRAVALDPAIAAAPWCERAVVTQQPGTFVAPPPGGGLESRLGHLIAVAPTPAECRAHLDEAATGMHADILPARNAR